jgi:hypothetical protein
MGPTGEEPWSSEARLGGLGRQNQHPDSSFFLYRQQTTRELCLGNELPPIDLTARLFPEPKIDGRELAFQGLA